MAYNRDLQGRTREPVVFDSVAQLELVLPERASWSRLLRFDVEGWRNWPRPARAGHRRTAGVAVPGDAGWPKGRRCGRCAQQSAVVWDWEGLTDAEMAVQPAKLTPEVGRCYDGQRFGGIPQRHPGGTARSGWRSNWPKSAGGRRGFAATTAGEEIGSGYELFAGSIPWRGQDFHPEPRHGSKMLQLGCGGVDHDVLTDNCCS